MRKLLILCCFLAIAFPVLVFSGSAIPLSFPPLISYQGMLKDSGGVPLTGSYDLTFRIYDDTTDGNLEWSETQSGVKVEDGLFNVVLGQETALDLPFDESYWLEVQVGSEIMPRLRFTSIGYAYRALVADSALAGPSGADADWTVSGDDMYSAVSGNVGIGTTSPGVKLNVDGGSDIDQGVANSGYLIIGSPTSRHIGMDNNEIMAKLSGTQGHYLGIGTGSAHTWFGSAVSIQSGWIGAGWLDIGGDVRVQGSEIKDAGGTPRIVLADDEKLYLSKDNGQEVLIVDELGWVGIGTINPLSRLHVNGNIKVNGEVTYSSPHTHYLSLGFYDFLPVYGVDYTAGEWNPQSDARGIYVDDPTNYSLVAPVHLPHGAVVTGFKGFVSDYDSDNLMLSLRRVGKQFGIWDYLASVQSYGMPGDTCISAVGISVPVIDNMNFSYEVIDDGRSNVDLRVFGAVITYTLDEAP